MESLSELTDSEEARVMEIALNSPEASAWLDKESVYEVRLRWIAILADETVSGFWQIDYDWEADENLKNVPAAAVFYPGVLIGFGEPEQWQVLVAVDLETEQVVHVQENPVRTGPHQPSPVPDLAVGDAAEARDAALNHLRVHKAQDTPSEGAAWEEEDVTPPGLIGAATKEFTYNSWIIRVSYPVVLPENTVYQVTVSNTDLGWQWKGSVKADGTVTEVD